MCMLYFLKNRTLHHSLNHVYSNGGNFIILSRTIGREVGGGQINKNLHIDRQFQYFCDNPL